MAALVATTSSSCRAVVSTTSSSSASSSSSFACGPLTIHAEFDSGNVLRAELAYPPLRPLDKKKKDGVGNNVVPASEAGYQPENLDYEINVWTKPDAHGTRFENLNRTWFHFAIKGGRSRGIVKINVLNLNKQNKLFLQGMQPVFRIVPERPKWERVSDRVMVNENKPTENGCNISFRVQLPHHPNQSTLYLAFTYPFGYLELCDLLKPLDREFLNTKASKVGTIKGGLKRRELWTNPSTENDIYYHRECLCYSLEGRRVDLITISSVYGISDKQEERLTNLFPIEEEPRPFKFPGKKVVFLSARVHPGETPSSFVLNGFLNFVLNKTDPRAVILRRLFCFKFIPILNPDGVYNGHYRTDPRGVNLNRVYLNPSQKLHPSIYAARKLLIYYHSGVDALDEDDEPSVVDNENLLQLQPERTPNSSLGSLDGEPGPQTAGSISMRKKKTKSKAKRERRDSVELFSEDTCFDVLPQATSSSSSTASKKPYTFILSDANSLCAGCVPSEELPVVSSSTSDLSPGEIPITHQCAFEACDEDSSSVHYENLKLGDQTRRTGNSTMTMEMEVDTQIDQVPSLESLTSTASSSNTEDNDAKTKTGRPPSSRRKKRGPIKERRRKLRPKSSSDIAVASVPILPRPRLSSMTSTTAERKMSRETNAILGSLKQTVDIRTPRLTRSQKSFPAHTTSGTGLKNGGSGSTSRYYNSTSGLFMYIDMHGHTTKRGIFMYGNHFPEVNTQAECMLVPRLMAVNSPHFDFAACNFTERLMCVKDRKEGLSREGSGRVACFKLTGLIRSYTLECNYNTGRIVNPVYSHSPTHNFTDTMPPSWFQPPKYTVELFEEVGKALAESVLDISGQNPFSRLGSTEFKTIDGMKRSLVNRLKISPEFNGMSHDALAKKSASVNLPLNSSGSPLLQSVASVLGTKSKRQKTKVVSGGPLGPKNGNQNIIVEKKPSVLNESSSSKSPTTVPKLGLGLLRLPSQEDATTSSATNLKHKSLLAKGMKNKAFPRFSSGIGKRKMKIKKKKSSPEVLQQQQQQQMPE